MSVKEPHGRGVLELVVSGVIIRGNFENGSAVSGHLADIDGAPYYGGFMQNEEGVFPHGQGTETVNGHKYVVEYKNGKRNGQGTCTWPNGRRYVGEWADDQMVD